MSHNIEKDPLTGKETTGHEWDGIKELNTPMPRWWLYVFYASIAVAILLCVLLPSFPIPFNGHTEGLLHYTERSHYEDLVKADSVEKGPKYSQINATEISQLASDPALRELRDFAIAGGHSAFSQNCISCHGAGGQGNKGFPNLTDDVWIWGGTIDQIYQTIQYGIRNNNPNSHGGVQMPAWGDADKNPPQVLTADQISDVIAYVQNLSSQGDDKSAIERGTAIYEENCSACHGEGGIGNQDLGAPPLNTGIWLYGGDKQTLTETITHGRAGMMPAWGDRFSPETIKMLALYVHQLGGGI